MPVIPFCTDHAESMQRTMGAGKEAGVDFVIFGLMTRKPGRQKDYFLNVIKDHYPELLPEYDLLYSSESQWGEPRADYCQGVHELFDKIAALLNLPKRMPPQIYKKLVSRNDFIIIIPEHLDYLLKLKNQKSPYGYAAYGISQLHAPIDSLNPSDILKIKGVGNTTFRIIHEIIQTGSSRFYEKLMNIPV